MNIKKGLKITIPLLVLVPLLGTIAFISTKGANADTNSITQGPYTLTITNNDPTMDPAVKQTMINTFFTIYPEEVNRFNPNAPKTVTWVIDTTYTGVAYTSGNSTHYASAYIHSNPKDTDTVTHESMHIVQQYTRGDGGDGWLVEGIAYYARYKYGV